MEFWSAAGAAPGPHSFYPAATGGIDKSWRGWPALDQGEGIRAVS